MALADRWKQAKHIFKRELAIRDAAEKSAEENAAEESAEENEAVESIEDDKWTEDKTC